MVLADGCFDPIHRGHMLYLRAAADLLGCPDCNWEAEDFAVRIAPDAAITAKGRTPFQAQAERADCVAAVIRGARCYFNDTLEAAVRELKPRLLVKGWDWHGKLPQDVIDACAEVGTAIVYVPTQTRSSSERLQG